MCWYVSYRLGRISADMEPSMTMKFLLPLALTPVTVLTKAALVATIDLPGSIMIVRPRSSTTLLMVSIKSFGVGSLSPLHHITSVTAMLLLLVRLCSKSCIPHLHLI